MAEEEPADDDMSYPQEFDTSAGVDEDGNYVQAYEEDSVVTQNVNLTEVVYQDDSEEDITYMERCPRNTMCFLVHITPEQ